MGPCHVKKKKTRKNRRYALATCDRTRDLDQIHDDLNKARSNEGAQDKNESEKRLKEFDEDLPGGGHYYCMETARHFVSADALEKHKLSKVYKNRLRQLKQPKYTQDDAEAAIGIKKESLPSARMIRGEDVLMRV